ncbi:MAG: hypothetical protein AAFW60_12380, partial [Pseudomonadota bacterium]
MTVLTAIQRACTVIGLEKPDSVYGSNEREHIELADLANEVAERIVKAHEWRELAVVHTITGDGSAEAHALPADYDRMPVEACVWLSQYQTPATRIDGVDEWLERQVRDIQYLYNHWILLGDNMNILPILTSTETAQ